VRRSEYLPRGSMYRLLHHTTTQLEYRRRLKMGIDVSKGMAYLHSAKPSIVHRDLKVRPSRPAPPGSCPGRSEARTPLQSFDPRSVDLRERGALCPEPRRPPPPPRSRRTCWWTRTLR
jgi:serine/threonine protein kinase